MSLAYWLKNARWLSDLGCSVFSTKALKLRMPPQSKSICVNWILLKNFIDSSWDVCSAETFEICTSKNSHWTSNLLLLFLIMSWLMNWVKRGLFCCSVSVIFLFKAGASPIGSSGSDSTSRYSVLLSFGAVGGILSLSLVGEMLSISLLRLL